jgi:predicted HTH domain antitoxin
MGRGLRISEDIVSATRMSEEELAREFAVFLYREAKVSLARAKAIAGMNCVAFQKLLARRGIPIRYGKAELQADLATLRKFSFPLPHRGRGRG